MINAPTNSKDIAIVRVIATKLMKTSNHRPLCDEFFWLNLPEEERVKVLDRISLRSQAYAHQATEILAALRSNGLIN